MEPQNKPSEDPNVVKGSVIDTPMDAPPPKSEPPKTEEPLYKGMLGDIKTPEELKTYAQNLEQMVVAAKAQNPNPQPAPVDTLVPLKKELSAREKFAEKIFSNPDEAFDIAVQEATRNINTQLGAQEREKQFWTRFYEKNEDLKGMETVVNSIVTANHAKLRDLKNFPDEKSVSDFLTKETRAIMDTVKKRVGGTETKLESRPAIVLGSSGEPAPVAPTSQDTGPINFTDQIRRMGRRKK